MPFILESVGLNDIGETNDWVLGWVGHSVERGRVFEGYSGNSYIHNKYKSAEIFACLMTEKKETEEGEYHEFHHVDQFDLQVSGPCVWKMHYADIALKNDSPSDMTKMAVVRNTDNGGFTIMNLLNADVLPSYLEGDEIVAQVAAFALNVHYYKDEDELAEASPSYEGTKFNELKGKKLMPVIGSVFPNGFLRSCALNKNNDGGEPDHSHDDLVLITGIVDEVLIKGIEFEGETISRFIAVRMETQFGRLELLHSREMMTDEEWQLLKEKHEGLIVQAVAVLSGDVAIYDYENGFVADYNNDLAALRYAMTKGKGYRLKNIMTDDVVYQSTSYEEQICGREKVIKFLDYIFEKSNIEWFSHFAILQNTNPGERCFVLAENDESNITLIVRIVVNEEGLITRIIISSDPNIKFQLEDHDF